MVELWKFSDRWGRWCAVFCLLWGLVEGTLAWLAWPNSIAWLDIVAAVVMFICVWTNLRMGMRRRFNGLTKEAIRYVIEINKRRRAAPWN